MTTPLAHLGDNIFIYMLHLLATRGGIIKLLGSNWGTGWGRFRMSVLVVVNAPAMPRTARPQPNGGVLSPTTSPLTGHIVTSGRTFELGGAWVAQDYPGKVLAPHSFFPQT
jgi:hypothetical protein